MISTPLDKYQKDVEELAALLEKKTGVKGVSRKNRVRFKKRVVLLRELGIN